MALERFEWSGAEDRLEKVISIIEDDPKSFDMGDWGYKSRGPSCGTVGCIAGWVVLGQFSNKALKAMNSNDIMTVVENCEDDAAEMLGLTRPEAEKLFFADYWPDPFLVQYDTARTKAAKAAVAVRRIRHFLETGE
jgi:hypothetical protein